MKVAQSGGGHGGASHHCEHRHQPRSDPQSPSLYMHIYGCNTRPCYMRSVLFRRKQNFE
jgi:hypothetical protein